MNTIKRLAVTVSLSLVSALLIGCPPSTGPGKIPSATQPTVPVAVEPVLDAKALTPLADLKPAIAKPVNPATPTSGSGVDVSSYIADAEKSLAKKDYLAAKKTLDQAIGFNPDNPRVQRDMGLAFVGLQNGGMAIKYLQRSAAAMPDDLEVQVLRGRLLLDQPDQAIFAFRTALLTGKANPANPLAAEAMLHLGNLLAKTGCLRASLDAYNQLGQWLDANAENYTGNPSLQPLLVRPEDLLLRRGSLMLKLKMPRQAAEALAKAYSGDHGNAEISRLLTESLIEDKQYDRAATLILEMASQPAQQAQLIPLAESLAIASGKKELPLKIWQEYLKTGKKESALALAMAEVSRKIGDLAQAEAILASAMEKQPGSVAIGKALAGLLISNGQYDTAVSRLAEIISRDSNQTSDAARALKQISAAAPADYHRQLAGKYTAQSAATAAQCYLAGLLANIRNDQALASKQFELALARDGNFLPAYEALLDLAVAQRQAADAKNVMARVNKLDDSQFAYFKAYLRGKVNLIAQNVEAAAKELEAARQAKGNYIPTLRLLAQCYLALSSPASDRTADAQGMLIEALRADSDNEETYRMLLGLLIQKNDLASAQQLLTQLFERHPDSMVGRIAQIEMFLKVNQKAEAMKLLEQVKKSAPESAQVQWLDFQIAYQGKQVAQFTDKEWLEAVDRLRGILKADTTQTQALRNLVLLLQAPNHKAQAADIWAKVYEESNKSLLVAKIYAEMLLSTGKSEQGLQIVQELYRNNPRDIVVRQLLLTALEKLKKNDQLIQLAESWLNDAQDEQERLPFRQVLLKLYEDKDNKQYDKAQKLLDNWILLSADTAVTVGLRGKKLDLYGKAAQYDKAIEYGRAWIDEARSDQQAARLPRLLLLELLTDGKQYDKALPLVEEFIQKDKEFRDLWQTQQIMLMGEAKQFDKGRQIALEIIAKNPAETSAREAVVIMYRRAGKHDEALKLIDSWLASPPKTLEAEVLDWCRISAVQLLVAQEKYNDAIRRVDAYLPLYKDWKPKPVAPPQPGMPPERIRPNPTIELLIYKGNALGELGQKDQQLALLDKLIAQYPDNALLQNDLGYLLADRGVQLDRAEKLVRQAFSAGGEKPSPSVMDSLGWVFYKKGKFADAMNVFNHILTIDEVKTGDTAVVFDHAGDIAFRAGNPDKAMEYWNTALTKASKETTPDRETRKVKASAVAKIAAVKKGKTPDVAPVPPPPPAATKPVAPVPAPPVKPIKK